MKGLYCESTNKLFEAIMKMDDISEFYAFFEDLCTVKEVKDLSQRFEVARLLNKGCSYQKISEITSASSATISRVKRCLEYGSGGYTNALKKIGEMK